MKLEHELKQTKPFRSEVQKLLLNISFTSSWISTIMTNKLKPFDITPSQYNVLRILKGKHPEAYCNHQIVERMIDKSSNVTRIVDKLVKKNLAIRSESAIDKRSVQIYISESGIKIIERIEIMLENSVESFSEFDAAKAKLMSDWLDELRG
jgi:DNA-binding MarR family transcriptional regulator